MGKWMVAMVLLAAGGASLADARAQTACPQGVAAGSFGCGPGPGAAAVEVRTYYDAYGAAAFSEERYKVYAATQHGGDQFGVEARAMQKCQADGAPSDCRVLQWWVNGCAALATGHAGDQMGMFWGFDADYRPRVAKRKALENCAAAGAHTCSVFELGRQSDAICLKRGYRTD